MALADGLKLAREMASEKKILLKFINIFCDTLIVQEGDRIEGASINIPSDATKYGDGSFSIQIYARKIVAPVAGEKPSLYVDMVPASMLIFWVPEVPTGFEFDLSSKSKSTVTRMKPTVDPTKFGVAYSCAASGEVRTNQLPPPKAALVNLNYLDLINEDGTMREQGYQNE